jgi:DNA polymerase
MPDDAGMADREAALFWLRWQADMGADEAIAPAPLDRFRATPPPPSATPGRARAQVAPTPAPAPAQPAPITAPPAPENAPSPEACHTLEELRAALDSLHHFPLRRTARHTVLTDGDPAARILLVGEAPGREEDLKGRPFVGRAGQLLDRMLAAIGLSREAGEPDKAVLISNVVFWRPPGNRKPSEQEVAFCMPWLERTIELAAPEFIVCLGATPTQRLTGRTQGVLKLRGNWFEYTSGGRAIPLLATLHPAYLLRQPVQKRLAWRDFLSLKLRLEEAGGA